MKQNGSVPGKNGFHCGMRYEPGWLIESLLLKMKSMKAYKHCRNNKLLPLPAVSTIRRLLSSSDVGFGFNELALENIGKMLAKCDRHLPVNMGARILLDI